MPYTVKIDLNVTRNQQIAIQDAYVRDAGVMTKLQAQQLVTLVANPSPDMQWSVTPIKTNDYIAAVNEFVLVDSGGGPLVVTLPLATAANEGDVIGVKSVTVGGTALSVDALGGQLIDGQATYGFSGQLAAVVFVSNGTGWDIGYFYLGKPVA